MLYFSTPLPNKQALKASRRRTGTFGGMDGPLEAKPAFKRILEECELIIIVQQNIQLTPVTQIFGIRIIKEIRQSLAQIEAKITISRSLLHINLPLSGKFETLARTFNA